MKPEQAARAADGLLPPSDADPLWWLSFADADRPSGEQFLGALITQAPSMEAAVTRSHVLGVNPGGSIAIAGPIPEEYIDAVWRDRLLSREEAESVPDPRTPLE